MKNKLLNNLLLGLFCLSLSSLASASPQQNITVQPLGLMFGTANAEYEIALSRSTSFAARLNYFNFTLADLNTNGIGGGISYRWYPSSGAAPKGFFIGPAVDIMQVSASNDGNKGSALFYSAGAELGYKWIWGEELGFVLSPSFNIGYRGGSFDVGDTNVDYSGIGVGIGLAMGMAF